jgi:hypothetical protein
MGFRDGSKRNDNDEKNYHDGFNLGFSSYVI